MLELLNDDNHYYGEVGKRYLSNSHISELLHNPEAFGKPREKTPDMVKGSYLHALCFEPEKANDFRVVSATSRNTNKYKEEADGDVLLLQPEADEILAMHSKLESNFETYELMHIDTESYETPAVGELFGAPWKGKADVVKPKMIVDLKTTSKIDDFKWSAKKYNYDSQAYIYSKLFGRPVVFLVIEKGSMRVAVVECSGQFLASGEQKVIHAVNVWARYFGPSATEDINKFINHIIL